MKKDEVKGYGVYVAQDVPKGTTVYDDKIGIHHYKILAKEEVQKAMKELSKEEAGDMLIHGFPQEDGKFYIPLANDQFMNHSKY